MDPDKSEPSTTPGKSGLPMIGWLLVFVLVGYPLSVGPVLKWSVAKKPPAPKMSAFAPPVAKKPPSAVMSIYAPLQYLYDNVPAVAVFYNWYLPLWGIK